MQRSKNSRKKVDKEFHNAIQQEDFNVAKLALNNGADINSIVNDETTLTKAVKNNKITTVNFLLNNGADINAQSNYSFPLMEAIESCHQYNTPDALKRTKNEVLALPYDFSICNLLIEKGADIEQLDMNNRGLIGTVLTYFPYHLNIQKEVISKKTVNTDDFVHFQPLYVAIQGDLEESVELLLNYGAKLKEGSMLNLAAKENAVNVFRFLLTSQKPLNDKKKRELFSSVSMGGSQKILAALVEYFKIDDIHILLDLVPISSFEIYNYLKIKGDIPETYLSKALLLELDKDDADKEYIKTLIEDGADIFSKNKEGHNTVYICAKNGHLDLLKHFLDLKIPPLNALFSCNIKYNIEIAELLLTFGADPQMKNKFSQTFIESLKEELWNMKDASKQDPMIKRQLRKEIERAELFIQWFMESNNEDQYFIDNLAGEGSHLMTDGKYKESIRLFERILVTSAEPNVSTGFYTDILWVLQKDNTGLPINKKLNKLALVKSIPKGAEYPAIFFNACCIYTEMKEYNKAYEMIEEAIAHHYDKNFMLSEIKTDTMFKEFREKTDVLNLLKNYIH